MVDLAANLGVTLRVDVRGAAETVGGKIGVVNVEIKQSAAGFLAIQKTGLPPGRGLSYAAESCAQRPTIAALVDGVLHPFPLGPKPQAHGGHEKAFGGRGGFGDFPGLRTGAGDGFFAQDVLAAS